MNKHKILVAAVVLVVVGAGAWYGLGRDEKSKTVSNNSTNTTEPSQNTSSELKQFSNNDFSFEYPKDWASAAGEEDEVVFTSGDYALEDQAHDERGTSYRLRAGNKLIVQTLSADAANKTIEELTAHVTAEEKNLGGGTHKVVTIDGNQALLVNNKHSDQYLYAIVYKGQKRVHIQLDAVNDSDAQTAALFDKILASLKIK